MWPLLKFTEKMKKEREKEKTESGENQDEWVVLKEDRKEVIQELTPLLFELGIPSKMILSPGCKAGACSAKCVLLVMKKNARAAHTSIEEYYMKKYPEIKVSQEWEAEGKCPACGYHIGANAKECPDCGLVLLFEG